jgi:putative addiction module component (TIGR02574 family)
MADEEEFSMSQRGTQLLEEALRLPERERADLAARLIESLHPTAEEDVEPAWSAEIRQRLEDMEQGRVQPVPWSEARRMILENTDESAEA